MFKNYWSLAVVIALSYFSIAPLFSAGFFPMHDNAQVARVHEMKKALLDGQFPVRWVADLGYGYGYPIFNFYSPLPYYIGGVVGIVGFDDLMATKIMFIIAALLSAGTMWYLGRRLFGETIAILIAILYQYAPYHALDLYVRGAVGELYAYAFLPLFFLGVICIIQKGIFSTWVKERSYWNDALIGGIGFAAIILSHNITAMLIVVVMGVILPVLVGIYWIRGFITSKLQIAFTMTYLGYLIIIGLLLSCFFWLPAVSEMQYTNVDSIIGGGADYHDHFVYLDQLWDSPWGFAGSAPGRMDGMSFKIGKVHILLAIIGFITAFIAITKRKKKEFSTAYIMGIGLVVLSLFMMISNSVVVWDVLRFLAYAQYPWRFLLFIIFGLSMLAGFATFIPMVLNYRMGSKVIGGIIMISIVVVLAFNVKYFKPQHTIAVTANDYTNDLMLKWTTSKISDEYMPYDIVKPRSEYEIVTSKFLFDKPVRVIDQQIKSHRYQVNVDVLQSSMLTIQTAYFPGWKIFIDHVAVPFTTYGGLMQATITSGQHTVRVELHDTPVRTFANIISVLSLLFITGKILPIRRMLARL